MTTSVHSRLPVSLTAFIGRRAELAAVSALIEQHRLVTITGPGGCGKTRLALATLTAVCDQRPDGCRWVELGPVTDAGRLADVVAAAAGALVDPSADRLRALTVQLGGRTMVLCLDNCEHLLDACAGLVTRVLQACPDVTVVATSREPLGIVGERVWPVPPLTDDEAVELFTDRARSVHPGYAVDDDNEVAVRTVCRRLDGIPLAVELAAAWVRMLTPAQISVALDDRFGILVGRRGVIPRQQTLAASVEWSYNLLRDDARGLLRRLAVFSGGFTLEAAVAVAAAGSLTGDGVLPALGRLVDASIVLVGERDGAARYRLPETIKEYASERLDEAGEAEAARLAHLHYFLAVAEDAAAALEHGDQDVLLAALEAEHDNFRAVLDRALTSEAPEPGRRLAAALTRMWFLRGHAHDGIRYVRQAIEVAPDDHSDLQAELLSDLALLAAPGGQVALSADAARRAVELSAANDDRASALAHAASMYAPFYFDFAVAQDHARRAQQLGEASGSVFAADFGMLIEACSLTNRDRHTEAVALAKTLYARAMPRRDRFCAAFARSVETWAALFTGDVRGAVTLAEEAVAISEPLQDFFTFGTNTTNLAWVMGLGGDVDRALALMADVVRAVEGAGPDVDVVNMTVVVGKLHLWNSDLEGAERWFGRAARFAAPNTDNWVAARALPGLSATMRRLGRRDEAGEHAERAVAVATRLEVPHVLAEGLDETAFLLADDDPSRATDLHHDALAIRVDHGLRTFVVDSLDALAVRKVAADQHIDAVRLAAASSAAREQSGYARPLVGRPDHETMLAASRAALGDAAFDEAQAGGSRLELDDAIAYVSRSRGARQRPSMGWASLTPTEHEVVALVAEGLTNPQIADRLFVSRATVKTHLSHVFAKIGVATRAELASLATSRQGTGRGP